MSDVSPIHWQYGAIARLKKVKRLINTCTMGILRCRSDISVFMNLLTL